MRTKWIGLVAAIATIFITSGPVLGQAIKIGYTDAQLIVAQMNEYRTILSQLQGMADSGQTEYQGLIQSYQEKLADYQKKQALLSDQARTTREQELTTMQGEIQQFLANKERELAQREEELMNPLLERVQNAINAVAGERGLTLVLNAQAAGSPVLLYADSSMDVTELVMNKLGIPKPAQSENQ